MNCGHHADDACEGCRPDLDDFRCLACDGDPCVCEDEPTASIPVETMRDLVGRP